MKKELLKHLQIQKKSVSLHPLKRKNNGRVAQLNRVADYGSAGYRFESCRGHKKINGIKSFSNGRVAQLNRVADYGSAGYRFESCRGHKKINGIKSFSNGRVAQLNRVADYGSAGYRFESCRGHKKEGMSYYTMNLLFFIHSYKNPPSILGLSLKTWGN